MTLRSGLTALVIMVLSCGVKGPDIPDLDWVYAAIRPPTVVRDGTTVNLYEDWWEQTEDCLGMRYEFKKVVWLVVRGVGENGTFKLGQMENLVGFTMSRPGRGVTILVSSKFWLTPAIVKHESVHAITGKMHGQIPEETFERCSKGGGS